MKKSFYFLLLVFLMSRVYSAPQIAIEGMAASDFGKYPSKDQKEASFKIKNTGDENLKIVRILKTCGACAEIKISNDEIKPGEVADVTLKVISGSLAGAYTKNFFIETNDPAQRYFKFTFTGDALPVAEIKPSAIIYAGRLEVGKAYRQSFQITPAGKGTEFGEPVVESNYEVKAAMSGKDDSYSLEFEFTPEKPLGEMRSKIRIPVLKPEGWKPLEIVISANVGFQLVAVPAKLILPLKLDAPVEKNFQIRYVGVEDQLKPEMLLFENPEGAEFRIAKVERNIFDMKGTFTRSFIDKLAEKRNIPVVFTVSGAEPATLVLSTE